MYIYVCTYICSVYVHTAYSVPDIREVTRSGVCVCVCVCCCLPVHANACACPCPWKRYDDNQSTKNAVHTCYITTTTTGGGNSLFYFSLLARIVENVVHAHVCMTYETFGMCNINHSQCCITLYSLRIKSPSPEFTHSACVKIANKKVSSPSYARFMKFARDLVRFDGSQVLFQPPLLSTHRYILDRLARICELVPKRVHVWFFRFPPRTRFIARLFSIVNF